MTTGVSFTVILLSYNHEPYLGQAIDSILSQAYLPEHLIIVDDCSQDKSVDLIKRILLTSAPPSIKIDLILKGQNAGVCSSINSCSHLISTDLVITAAADDVSFPDRLAFLSRAWTSHGRPDALYSGAVLINECSEKLGYFQPHHRMQQADKVFSARDSFRLPAFYGAGSCYSSRVFTDFGPLPTVIRNEDFLLMFRAWILGGVAYSGESLIGYRQHGSNLSINRQLALSTRFASRCKLRFRGYWNYVLNLYYALKSLDHLSSLVLYRVYLVIVIEVFKTGLRFLSVPFVELSLLCRRQRTSGEAT